MNERVVSTNSLEETFAFGRVLGQAMRGGEVFELQSDVGGGKTSLVKGMARGLEIQDTVQSPSFTISRIYNARDGLELHHFDFYRLQEAGVVAAELAESLALPNVIVAVEWGDIVHDVLPANKCTIRISSPSESGRIWHLNAPSSYNYLFENVKSIERTE